MKTEIFQSTLPRGERHLRREIQRQFIHNFNPRSREGSDKAQHIQETVQDNFNPRSREGSDLGNLVHVLAITIFSTHFLQVFIISIRAPARGATVNVSIPLSPHLFQSALPRGERPPVQNCPNHFGIISIRAPARGATVLSQWKPHRPRHFNPRSRKGSDLQHQPTYLLLPISIRAPARGATPVTLPP